ncbi:MAG: hypothetical protein SFV54_25120 [Bryobacteraceae bacterium]|nr:hypothetical protein [Bryobacteraceae bacterium]
MRALLLLAAQLLPFSALLFPTPRFLSPLLLFMAQAELLLSLLPIPQLAHQR